MSKRAARKPSHNMPGPQFFGMTKRWPIRSRVGSSLKLLRRIVINADNLSRRITLSLHKEWIATDGSVTGVGSGPHRTQNEEKYEAYTPQSPCFHYLGCDCDLAPGVFPSVCADACPGQDRPDNRTGD